VGSATIPVLAADETMTAHCEHLNTNAPERRQQRPMAGVKPLVRGMRVNLASHINAPICLRDEAGVKLIIGSLTEIRIESSFVPHIAALGAEPQDFDFSGHPDIEVQSRE
jgi:hypothetical protein|tara:strand:- start:293 stop:622 length:330 start_codon:yes stop_codon:yes gene_type:complete